ncbi:response regulator [Endothiovibrio diazotrophicus]
MIRLMIADDHAIVREGLRRLFATRDNLAVVAEAASAPEVLACLSETIPDLLLLDLSMPGTLGTELITRVHAARPRLPILVLTMHDEAQTARRALNAGAAGYLTKDNDPETLLEAIHKVALGQRYIDPKLAEAIVFAAVTGPTAPHERLNQGEQFILRRLLEGAGVAAIAGELAITPRTASTRKTRMMDKLGVASNAELVRYALEWGLLQ